MICLLRIHIDILLLCLLDTVHAEENVNSLVDLFDLKSATYFFSEQASAASSYEGGQHTA